jgi:KaiC/GvpD/RAD55 family RecA-like ATPase
MVLSIDPDRTPEGGSAFRYQATGIGDLDALLPQDPSQGIPGGIRASNTGFFAVVSGAAGTGKSILAMQLACAFASQGKTVIYVTQETFELVDARISTFDRFNLDVKVATMEDKDPASPKTVHVAHLPFGEKEQIAILYNAFHSVRFGGQPENALVCLDNVDVVSDSALLAAAAEHKWAGRGASFASQLHDGKVPHGTFLKMLRAEFAELKLNMCFVVEETRPPGDGEAHSTPEAFAADLLIRLGVTTHGGYRERFLEIVKAKNQFHYRGKHHFAIVSRDGGGRHDSAPRAYGIVIAPSVASQLSMVRARAGNPIDASTPVELDIEGLLPDKGKLKLNPGSVSVLVSDQGVKATRIAITLANSQEARACYISFANTSEQLESLQLSSDVRLHHFPPEHISASKLMWDISTGLRSDADKGTNLVIVDHVFELQKRYPLINDPKHFLAALMELFRKLRLVAVVVDTVDVALGEDPIEKSVAAGLADNVFVLRRVEFRSRPHMVFSVAKLLTSDDREKRLVDRIWGLEDTGRELVASETFDTFKNVLSGDPVPVRFALTLYQDQSKSPFHDYLERTAQALTHTFGESIDVRYYGPDDYARVQTFLSLARSSQRADCHIIAVDEFWLHQLLDEDLLEDITDYVGDIGDRNAYVTGAHDLALHQLGRSPSRWYAVPSRNNVGVLCYDPQLLKSLLELLGDEHSELKQRVEAWRNGTETTLRWTDLLDLRKVFLTNAQHFKFEQHGAPRFFTFCRDQLQSSASFLLELALSFDPDRHILNGKREDAPAQSLRNDRSLWSKTLELVLDLLCDEELNDICDNASRPTADEPHALFSRQWFSTYGTLRASRGQPWCGRLEFRSLPVGARKTPTPVSGAWYVGILKGSISVQAGVHILRHFTSVENELFKLNNLIGLPIRSPFYDSQLDDGPTPTAEPDDAALTNAPANFGLPYARRFSELARRQEGANPEVLLENYPFYRIRVANYEHAAAVAWRAVRNLAREYLALEQAERPAKRQALIENALSRARAEYKALGLAKSRERAQ